MQQRAKRLTQVAVASKLFLATPRPGFLLKKLEIFQVSIIKVIILCK
jgi:hypothetical protein